MTSDSALPAGVGAQASKDAFSLNKDDHHSQLAKGVGKQVGSISKVVNDAAATWDKSGPDRRRFVARFDMRPISSCRDISRIFRETAAELESGKSIPVAEASMKAKFEEFYRKGDRPNLVRNSIKDDWQPFLRNLDTIIEKEFSGEARKSEKVAEFVLLELAVSFTNLADLWRGASVDHENTSDETSESSYGRTTTSRGGSSSSGNERCCPKRKRCRCSRLLLGF